MTGRPILHRLDDLSKPKVIFKGYPEFKETETFFKMPCDGTLDEILLGKFFWEKKCREWNAVINLYFSPLLAFIKGALIILLLRVIVITLQMLEEVFKKRYVNINDSEPVRFGMYAKGLVWLVRIDFLCLFILFVLLGVLYEATAKTKRCKYNVP
jgi:hypothetical protein